MPRFLVVAVLLLAPGAWGRVSVPEGAWVNLHPELVTKYGYRVEPVELISGRQKTPQFRCEVWANWADGQYQMSIAYREKRGQAVKDCEEWMNEAEKRIRRAKGMK